VGGIGYRVSDTSLGRSIESLERGMVAPRRLPLCARTPGLETKLPRLGALEISTALGVDGELGGERLLGRLPFRAGARLRSRISA
jgi:hypothetical protein